MFYNKPWPFTYDGDWLHDQDEEETKMPNLNFLDETAPTQIEFYAAGVQFRPNWKEALNMLKEGEELLLIPEPTNPHDGEAVALHSFSGTFLGYVPASKANKKNLWVLERLDQAKELTTTVLEVNPLANPWHALKVEVREGGQDSEASEASEAS